MKLFKLHNFYNATLPELTLCLDYIIYMIDINYITNDENQSL